MGRNISIIVTIKEDNTQLITSMRSSNQIFIKDISIKIEKGNKRLIAFTDEAIDGFKAINEQINFTGKTIKEFNQEINDIYFENIQTNLTNITQISGKNSKNSEFVNGMGNSNGIAFSNNFSTSSWYSSINKEPTHVEDLSFMEIVSSGVEGASDALFFASSLGMSLLGIPGLVIAGLAAAAKIAFSYFDKEEEKKQAEKSNRDESFVSYVNDQFDSIIKSQNEIIQSGSAYAANKKFLDASDDLQKAKNNLDYYAGIGFNSVRTAGMNNQAEFLNALSDNKYIQGALGIIGEQQGSLEGLSEEYKREALNTIMGNSSNLEKFSQTGKTQLAILRDEYAASEKKYTEAAANDVEVRREAEIAMGRILEEATGISINEYNANDFVQGIQQDNINLLKDIGGFAASNEEYFNIGLEFCEQFSKGVEDSDIYKDIRDKRYKEASDKAYDYADKNGISIFDSEKMQQIIDLFLQDPNWDKRTPFILPNKGEPKDYLPQAYGFSFVPYNNFPALLHEGERVLNASEARGYNKELPSFTVDGNYYIREEDDVSKVAQEIIKQYLKLFNREPSVKISGNYNINQDADINEISREFVSQIGRVGVGIN